MTKSIFYIFVSYALILQTSLFAKEDNILESQPQILFKYKHLTKESTKVELKIKFNNAVLYLEQKQFQKAIKLFKQTEKIMKVASWLNIGIAYYKLKSRNNAYLYLKKIYDVKEASTQAPYSYMSAAYYLYKITNNKKFMKEIVSLSKKLPNLDEHTKRLIVDVHIELKDYRSALEVLKSMKYPIALKIAMLHIKLDEYESAMLYLNQAQGLVANDMMLNKVVWLKVFTSLKANNFNWLEDNLEIVLKRDKIFHTHIEMPLELFFNENKLSPKEYFDKSTKFNKNRKTDLIFYFSPYIFADNDEVKVESTQAFILKNEKNLNELDNIIEYNAILMKIIKDDPIKRAYKLQNLLNVDNKIYPYEYYNLALAYAQVDEFSKAYKYFNKAYGLQKANKLFAAMTLISADRMKVTLHKDKREALINNILIKKGMYNFFGQYIYKIIYDSTLVPDKKTLTMEYKKSIFFRSLYFLENVDKKGIRKDEALFTEFPKDPLVYMLTQVAREKDESDYQYISRIQDNMPTVYNNYFIKGPMIITRTYIDILKAIGLFKVANLNINLDTTATYYRTKALINLYYKDPESSISLVEYLQKQYDLKDKYTYMLLIASYLEANKKDEASLSLYEAKNVLKHDTDISFLIGIKFLNELKVQTSRQYFKEVYEGDLIDFKLVGFDKLLEDI